MAAKSSTSQPKATWQDVEANDMVIVRTCRRFFSGADCEDACQDARIKAFKGLSKFRGDAKLTTWLYRVAFSICLMRLREMKQKKHSCASSLEEMQGFGYDVTDPHPGPHRAAVAKEAVDHLRRQPRLKLHLGRMQQRADGAMLKEMAAMRGVTIGTVKRADVIARTKLKSALAGHVTK